MVGERGLSEVLKDFLLWEELVLSDARFRAQVYEVWVKDSEAIDSGGDGD